MKCIIPLLAVTALTGCVALEPNDVRVETEHLSHASQHFGAHPTHMGAETLNVIAAWRYKGAYVEMGEGYNVSPADGHMCIGGICGPREVFTAAAGYRFVLKP